MALNSSDDKSNLKPIKGQENKPKQKKLMDPVQQSFWDKRQQDVL